MNVIFRADASTHIGTGHIVRCLSLADALKQQGCTILFATIAQPGDANEIIASRGYEIIHLAKDLELAPVPGDDDYSNWLRRDIIDDASEFITLAQDQITDVDVVITDHYSIEKIWQQHVKASLKCSIVAIDDLNREHCADVVLDSVLGRIPSDYFDVPCKLFGPQYALLRPKFSMAREQQLTREYSSDVSRVMISMGGIDQPNASLKFAKALVEHYPKITFSVLMSRRSPHFDEMANYSESISNLEHIEFIEDMAAFMEQQDLAIGAIGGSTWERACLGLSSLAVALADNQNEICRQLKINEMAEVIDLSASSDDIAQAFERLLQRQALYRQNGMKACDGYGAARVACAIASLSTRSVKLHLELAKKDDMPTVFEWQQHPSTREFALTPEPPSWEQHQRWMSTKISTTDNYFYMARDMVNGHPLGVIRLDREITGEYLVSIFVSPEHYGRGIAKTMLAQCCVIHPNLTLNATVLEANLASQKLFERAGFTRLSSESFTRPAHSKAR